jgi:hypothetical protein
MRKCVGCCIGLQSQLQFSHCLLLYRNLKSDVRNGYFIVKSALNFNESVTVGMIIDIFFDFVYSFYNVFDGVEYAFASHHVTDGKNDRLLILKFFLYLIFIVFLLLIQLFINIPYSHSLLLCLFIFVVFKQHLFDDSSDCFRIRVTVIVFKSQFDRKTIFQTSLFDQCFKERFAFLSNIGVVLDDRLQLLLLLVWI